MAVGVLLSGFIKLLIATAVSFCFFFTPTLSADLSYVGAAKNIYTPYGYKPTTHVFSLSGPLRVGDSEKARNLFESYLKNTTVFCETEKPAVIQLNSEGGSFKEGLKLAELFRQKGVGTIVKSTHRCLSACGVAFLGGTRELCLDGDRGRYRRIEPGAQLGFHAPSLLVPERSYTRAQISRSYDTAVKQIGQLVNEMLKSGIPSSLVTEMLKVGAKDFYFIDTVGKAGRWNFDVAVAGLKSITRMSLTTACANADAWSNDRFLPTVDFDMSPEGMTRESWGRLFILDRLGNMQRAYIQATGMYAKACMVELGVWPNTGRPKYWAKFFDESIQDVSKMYRRRSLEAAGVVLTPLHFYPQSMQLRKLPVAK